MYPSPWCPVTGQDAGLLDPVGCLDGNVSPLTSFRRLTSIKALWRWHVELVVEFFRKSIQCSLKELPLIHYREPQADRRLEKSLSSFLCGEVKQTMTINLIFSGSLQQLITHLTSLCTRRYEMCWGDED